jgi:phage tail protein X
LEYDAAGQRSRNTYATVSNPASDISTDPSLYYSETYSYTYNGFLEDVFINDKLAAQRTVDAAGNVWSYAEFLNLTPPPDTPAPEPVPVDPNAGVSYRRPAYRALPGPGAIASKILNYSIDGDGIVLRVETPLDGGYTEYQNNLVYGAEMDAAGNAIVVRTHSVQNNQGVDTWTHYYYEKWDSKKKSMAKFTARADWLGTNNESWQAGISEHRYDANGHLNTVIDHEEQTGKSNRQINFISNQNGQILRREEFIGSQIQRRHYFYYLNGHGVGDVGDLDNPNDLLSGRERATDYAQILAQQGTQIAVSGNSTDKTSFEQLPYRVSPVTSADFDQNYIAISPMYPRTTIQSYVTSVGENLSSVAQAVWGDGTLWYIIADANGIADANTVFPAGTRLTIPNIVANVHHTSETFRPYDPGQIIGNTDPTLPQAPQPPQPKQECWKVVLVIIVVVVVTYYTAGALTEAVGAWGAGIIGAAVGNAAGQGVAIGVGLQGSFDWKSFRTSVLTAAVLGGIDYAANASSAPAGTEAVLEAENGATAVEFGADTAAATASAGETAAVAMRIPTSSWRLALFKGVAAEMVAGATGQDSTPGIAGILASTITASIQGSEWYGTAVQGPSNYGASNSWGGTFGDLGRNFVNATVSEAVNTLVIKDHKFEWANVAGDSIGNTINNLTPYARPRVGSQQERELRDRGIAVVDDGRNNSVSTLGIDTEMPSYDGPDMGGEQYFPADSFPTEPQSNRNPNVGRLLVNRKTIDDQGRVIISGGELQPLDANGMEYISVMGPGTSGMEHGPFGSRQNAMGPSEISNTTDISGGRSIFDDYDSLNTMSALTDIYANLGVGLEGGPRSLLIDTALQSHTELLQYMGDLHGMRPDAIPAAIKWEFTQNWSGYFSDLVWGGTPQIPFSANNGSGFGESHYTTLQESGEFGMFPGISIETANALRNDLPSMIAIAGMRMAEHRDMYFQKTGIDLSDNAPALAWLYNSSQGSIRDSYDSKVKQIERNQIPSLSIQNDMAYWVSKNIQQFSWVQPIRPLPTPVSPVPYVYTVSPERK